jgi:ABC-2 type transport system permease protein
MMTAGTRPAGQTAPPLAVRARDLLACEWTKFWSVRSAFWTLLVATLTPVAFSDLLAFLFAQPSAKRPPGPPSDPLSPAFYSLEYAVLAVCVLGVLQFSSEYGTGLIRTTFAAVPRRRAVLAAKAVVTGLTTLAAGEIASFASFFIDQAVLHARHLGVPWSHPGVPGAVAASGTLLFVCAMLGLALGAITRHTAGGIAATVALIILPSLAGLFPRPWGSRIGGFTIIDAAQQVALLHPQANMFSPAISMLVLLAWPAIALVIAAAVITRTEA